MLAGRFTNRQWAITRTVQMSLTFKQLNGITNCSSTVNLEGRGKVVLTYTFAIHLFSYERRYNVESLSLLPVDAVARDRRVRLSADAVAKDRTLTARLQRCTGVPRRVSTACQRSIAEP